MNFPFFFLKILSLTMHEFLGINNARRIRFGFMTTKKRLRNGVILFLLRCAACGAPIRAPARDHTFRQRAPFNKSDRVDVPDEVPLFIRLARLILADSFPIRATWRKRAFSRGPTANIARCNFRCPRFQSVRPSRALAKEGERIRPANNVTATSPEW